MRSPVQRGREAVVTGVDSGFATLGIATVIGDPALGVAGARLVRLEFHGTEKADKKARKLVRVSTDDHRRVVLMSDAVASAVDKDASDALAVEWFMPNPKQGGFGSGGWKAAITVGAVLRVGREREIAVLDQLPADTKALVGSRSASKEDVTAWLCEHLRGFQEAVEKIPKTKREHPSDAAAHALVGLIELGARRQAAGL